MAVSEELMQSLESSIIHLTREASDTDHNGATVCVKLAMAANQLAEARAWMLSPGNAHGGSSYADG